MRSTFDQAYWIGHPDTLLPLRGARGSLSVEADEGVTFQTSMSGVVRARVRRKRAPRKWEVSIPAAHPGDIVGLQTLLAATLPPYQWVTPEAQVSNVLTPEQSILSDLIQPSSGLAHGGWWPLRGVYDGPGALSRVNPQAQGGNVAGVFLGPFPVPPAWVGRDVTVAAWLATARTAGARVQLQWLDAAGAQVSGAVRGSFVTGMDALRRSTATGTPPAGAVAGRLYIPYAEVIAQAQASWTPRPVTWVPGNGAMHTVIEEHSHDVRVAAMGRGKRVTDVSFTVREVGP